MKKNKFNRKVWQFFLFLLLPVFPAGAQELEDYLQLAAENNAGLQAAYADFEAAMQKAPQVRSLPDPTLTMSAFGRRLETRLGPQEAQFSLMQMFPWFGTLSAREDAAELTAEARFQAFLNERNQLFLQVSEQYYRLFELEKKISFQQENLKILEDLKELALARVRAGDGSLADVLQVNLLHNETETTLEILGWERKPLLAGFNALLNRNKSAAVVVPGELLLENPDLVEIGQEALEEHPQVEALNKMAEAAVSQELAAQKSGLPTLGLGLNYMIIGEQTAMNPVGNGQDVIIPMFSVSLPIFRKKYKAARKEAEFMQESYSQQGIEVKNKLGAQLETAVFEAERIREMLSLYKEQVETSKQVLDLLLSAYSNSEANFEEVLRVRQELLKYQLEIAGAKADYFTQLARIKYLTGNSY